MRLPVPMLLMLYLLPVLIDWYILADLRHSKHRETTEPLFPFRENFSKAPWIYIYTGVACLALLTVAVSLPRREGASLQPVWWLLYIFLTIYVGKLGYILGSLAGRIPQIWRAKRADTRMWLGLPLALLCVFTLVWGAVVGRRHIDVRQVTVESPDIPPTFDGYRIVQFSDTHVDTWGDDTTFVAELVDRINSLNPDLIVFTGDIVSRRTAEIRPFVKPFSRLRATDGIYSILGNHDYGDYYEWPSDKAKQESLDELIHIQEGFGWIMLNNASATIRSGSDSIVLIGVENWGEPPFPRYGDLGKATGGSRDPDAFKILLSHNPMHWHSEVRRDNDIDLTLSGHTHAMQCLFSLGDYRFSPAQWRYPEWSGLYSSPAPEGKLSQLYVNIGAGEVAMPSRIGTAFPEITVITLRRTKR